MKKLIYSPDYREKMIRMRKYLDLEFGQDVRKKVFSEISHRIQLLKTQNYLGISLREMYGIDCEFYYIYVAHNLVFYEIGDNDIRIISIYHEREDYIIKFLGSRARLHEESSSQSEWIDR